MELLFQEILILTAAVDPKLVKDKKNFIIKLRLNFPNFPIDEIKEKLEGKKYFRLKKRSIKLKKKSSGLWGKGNKI